MKKIISLFKRDFDGNPNLVLPVYNDGTEWVREGRGFATRKWDGTPVMYQDGSVYKRFDLKPGRSLPERPDNVFAYPFAFPCQAEADAVTGHFPYWVAVDPNAKEDKWIWEAYQGYLAQNVVPLANGWTYEAVGPKINGNNDGFNGYTLMPHGGRILTGVPTDYEGLKAQFRGNRIEGIVWHNRATGEMVKIKRSDFGYSWPEKPVNVLNSAN